MSHLGVSWPGLGLAVRSVTNSPAEEAQPPANDHIAARVGRCVATHQYQPRALGTPRQIWAPTIVPILQHCEGGGGPTGAQSMHMHAIPTSHGQNQLHCSSSWRRGSHVPAPQLTSS